MNALGVCQRALPYQPLSLGLHHHTITISFLLEVSSQGPSQVGDPFFRMSWFAVLQSRLATKRNWNLTSGLQKKGRIGSSGCTTTPRLFISTACRWIRKQVVMHFKSLVLSIVPGVRSMQHGRGPCSEVMPAFGHVWLKTSDAVDVLLLFGGYSHKCSNHTFTPCLNVF